ncbi:MAG: Gfo/Idh/MocA family oxidoreductase, partial [Burkholderiaceae bacterium]|nr:Gfo/Idh/MocA family oxidoreductase [Microbacteriaceae bacterium]
MSRLRVAMIGAGSIAAKHLRAYADNPVVDLVAVHDINFGRAAERAEEFGATHAYRTLAEVLDNPEIDAVSVCTWNDSHAELAIASLDAGKHVLLEKPLSKTVAEAEAIAAAVARSGRHLQVGFVRR